jgi:predicted aconitase with swiveling domain
MGFVLLEAIVRNVSPAAIVCAHGEPLLSSGALCAEIFFDHPFPIVDQIDFYELEKIQNGTLIKVNGDLGTVEFDNPET